MRVAEADKNKLAKKLETQGIKNSQMSANELAKTMLTTEKKVLKQYNDKFTP